MLITPDPNEQELFSETIASMVAQTIRRHRWIIVDDGSTDGTGAVADQGVKTNPWIAVVHHADRGFLKRVGE